jgi:hypothetical protein
MMGELGRVGPRVYLKTRGAARSWQDGLLLIVLWQTPGKQNPAATGQNILPMVEFIRDRRTCDLAAGAGVPQSCAIAGIEGKSTAAGVAGERDA